MESKNVDDVLLTNKTLKGAFTAIRRNYNTIKVNLTDDNDKAGEVISGLVRRYYSAEEAFKP